tara:strand:- start:1352 stop:2278 length:927 start_codon:yes stop_codon:yes gene_type:complete
MFLKFLKNPKNLIQNILKRDERTLRRNEVEIVISNIVPNERFGKSIVFVINHYAREVSNSRSHIFLIFAESFRSTFVGSRLGVLWNYVMPLIPLSVYLMLTQIRVFPEFDGVSGAAFVTFGVFNWFLLVGPINKTIHTISSRNRLVTTTELNLSVYVLSDLAQIMFDALIRFVFVLIIMLVTSTYPTWGLFFLPFVLVLSFTFSLALGILLGLLNLVANDVSRLVSIFLQYGIFLSGVIFPVTDMAFLSYINWLNPFAIFIKYSRELVFHGSISNWFELLGILLFSILIFIWSLKVFYNMERKIRGLS